MTEYSTNTVRSVLRDLGLRRAGRGKASGHELWVTPSMATVKPKLCNKECLHVDIYALGLALENLGVVSRRKFIRKVKGAR